MRFPWLQVDADFITAKASDLGALLGISRREAMGLALDLWTWALARAPADAPPEGFVTGTGAEPDRLLAGSVGWTGPVEQLVKALLSVGLAVRIEDGYRLTGFSRYKTTWEKNRRRTGGKPERNRTGTGAGPARKTQTQKKIEEETPLPPLSRPRPHQPTPTQVARDAQGLLPHEPGEGLRGEPLRDAVDAVHRQLRGVPYPWQDARDGAAAGKLLEYTSAQGLRGDEACREIARRMGHGLQRAADRYSPGAERAATLAQLTRQETWCANAVPPEPRQQAQPARGPPARSEPSPPGDELECAGCGKVGQGGRVGSPPVWLGYDCGCLAALKLEDMDYKQFADWARRRRSKAA